VSALARRAATILALATCALPAGSAQAAPRENVATAINQTDATKVFDFAWQVTKQRGDGTVDHRNRATARARCVRCSARAIAFQIVLVSGSPSAVVPVNTAEATNVECTECDVAAEARQFVRVFPKPIRLTHEGRRELRGVRRQLAALEREDPPPAELHAAVEKQEARVKEVLGDDVVLTSDPDVEAHAIAGRSSQNSDRG
jgi:hypothetical protein